MSYNCPKCASENIQKFSEIYNIGTSHLKVPGGNGIERIDGKDVWVSLPDKKYIQRTNSAIKTAPPVLDTGEKSSAVYWVTLFIFAFISLNYKFFILPTVIISIPILYITSSRQRSNEIRKSERTKKYNEEMEVWRKMWHCNKCGYDFSLEEESTQ